MKKIRCCAMINSPGELNSPEFYERITDYEKVFTDTFQSKIDAAAGPDKWAIEFIQFAMYSTPIVIFADMYLDDISLFNPIREVLDKGLNDLKHIEFKYYFRGDLNALRSRYQQ